jgi:putative ABC transport system permease protein
MKNAKTPEGGGALLKSYLKTAVRNFWRNKSFSFINITGLAIGMAVSFLILLYVRNELSYDRYHKNSREIFRIALRMDAEGRTLDIASVPAPMGPKSVETYPEIINSARIRESNKKIVQYEDNIFEESRFLSGPVSIFLFTCGNLQVPAKGRERPTQFP